MTERGPGYLIDTCLLTFLMYCQWAVLEKADFLAEDLGSFVSDVVRRIVGQSEDIHRFGGRLAPFGKNKEESVLISNWQGHCQFQPCASLFTKRCESAAEAVDGLRLANDS
jgi:hypothetical protein